MDPFGASRRLFDPQEASAYLRIAKQTLARWRCYGLGPRFVRIGGRIFYDVADLDAFIAARKFHRRPKLTRRLERAARCVMRQGSPMTTSWLSDWERNFQASMVAWKGELTPAAGEARPDRTGS